jgi:hypothetical protein
MVGYRDDVNMSHQQTTGAAEGWHRAIKANPAGVMCRFRLDRSLHMLQHVSVARQQVQVSERATGVSGTNSHAPT